MKKNFQIKYHFCVNPSQSDTAKISKIIFDNIKVMFFFSVQLNLCNKNLQGVIEWFENSWNKSNASFIVYDIEILSYQYHWSYFDKNRRVWCCNEMFWRYYNLQVNWCLHSAFVKNCFEKRERWFVPWGKTRNNPKFTRCWNWTKKKANNLHLPRWQISNVSFNQDVFDRAKSTQEQSLRNSVFNEVFKYKKKKKIVKSKLRMAKKRTEERRSYGLIYPFPWV